MMCSLLWIYGVGRCELENNYYEWILVLKWFWRICPTVERLGWMMAMGLLTVLASLRPEIVA